MAWNGVGRPFGPEDDAIIRQFGRRERLCDLSRRLGRASGSVAKRMQALERGAAGAPGAKTRTRRVCLCCRRRFESEGIHDRLCPGCGDCGGVHGK